MAEWTAFVGQYLKLAEREVLTHSGRVSHDDMLRIVDRRYAEFDAGRKQAEREAAEIEHEKEVEAEIRRIEAEVTDAKKLPTPAARKRGGRKGETT